MQSLKSTHYRRSYSTYVPCALRQCCIRDTVSRDFPYILLSHSVKNCLVETKCDITVHHFSFG